VYLERARAQQLRDVPPLRRPLRLRRRADGEDRVLRRDAGAVLVIQHVVRRQARHLGVEQHLVLGVGLAGDGARRYVDRRLDLEVDGGHVVVDVEQLEVAQVERVVERHGVLAQLVALERNRQERHLVYTM